MDYVLYYYELGIYTDSDIEEFISARWITREQYDKTREKMGLPPSVPPEA